MAATGTAQSKHALVGTWKLVSFRTTNEKGEGRDVYGPSPIGFLTYTADGRFSVTMAHTARKPFSHTPPFSNEEKAGAFDTFFAYAGSYTFNDDQAIHHIEAASYQDFVNTDQVRSVKLESDRLTLRGGFLVGGVMYGANTNTELVWERLKPETAGK